MGTTGLPLGDPCSSTSSATSFPSRSSPNTTCLPSRCGHGASVMKNWLPFVSGPRLAIDSCMGLACGMPKASSSNSPPYMDAPPVPSPRVVSPPCSMKPGITRCSGLPFRCVPSPPFSPVHRHRKFSTVFGTWLPYSPSSTRRDMAPSPICMSRNTLCVIVRSAGGGSSLSRSSSHGRPPVFAALSMLTMSTLPSPSSSSSGTSGSSSSQ
mmetsp:Transcript_23881/g.81438  ORF Transcript_23881/g.81438 Transcript_23881/m.81438 type:complete len:210 (+) Transcript_23881:111-740(+)